MATITASTTVGLYLCTEENGQIAGNTPGGIDLAALVNGASYVYCDTVKAFDHRINFMYSDAFPGHKSMGAVVSGGVGESTGGHEQGVFLVSLEMTESNGYAWKEISKRNNRPAHAQLHLIHQRASNTFEQFPDAATPQLKNYCRVFIMDLDVQEINGKLDIKTVTITLGEQWDD